MPQERTHSRSDKQHAQENLDQIKAEGYVRLKKILQILKAAFAESATELKSGATAVSPATRSLRKETGEALKEIGQKTFTEAQDVWASRAQEKSWKDRLRAEWRAMAKAFRATLSHSRKNKPTNERDEIIIPAGSDLPEKADDAQ